MALLRRRPDRIRGVAGSLTGKRLLVADSATPAAAGVVEVAAEAGGDVVAASADHVAIDLLLRRLANSPGSVAGAVAGTAWTVTDLGDWRQPPDAVVISPSQWLLGDGDEAGPLTPPRAVQLAESAAGFMRDSGRLGAVLFIATVSSAREDAAGSSYLRAEAQRLARLFSPNGIRINTVAVGHVATNRRGNPVPSRSAPLGHVSTHPVEVGKAAWFLINDDLSAGFTGAELTLDRGASLLRPDW
ncbi:MAG: SDR family oxidoreductase [Acidimicrobiia bacterium]|nr:SDR family oxidoreductase [Acidimicrobiia bacterium]